MNNKTTITSMILSVIGGIAVNQSLAAEPPLNPHMVDRGRYLVMVSGCNDCHTAGYLPSDGNIPEERWLTGDSFGWNGPWGTTYASNLRLFMKDMTEDQWVQAAKTLRRRPPMPWYNLNAMNEDDLRAIYQFTRSLGAPGEPAPDYVPVGQTPKPPFAVFPAPPGPATTESKGNT